MDLDGQWTQVGDLNQARSSHNVIFDGENMMVIGGTGTYQTEKCSINSWSVSCTSQNPELYFYDDYPGLFLVSDSFCKM